MSTSLGRRLRTPCTRTSCTWRRAGEWDCSSSGLATCSGRTWTSTSTGCPELFCVHGHVAVAVAVHAHDHVNVNVGQCPGSPLLVTPGPPGSPGAGVGSG